MNTLTLLVNQAATIEQMLIESGGEITPDIEVALAVTETALPEKVDNYSLVLERFEALEKHYKSRADFFAKISKQCSGVQERLKNNIKFAMQELGVNEIKGNDIRFKLSATKGSLVIDEPEMVPVDFKKEVITTEIDKKSLKEALEEGEIAGAHIEPGFSLRMCANTPEQKKKVAVNE